MSGLHVHLVTEKTTWGQRQRWYAERLDRDELGIGRKRMDAIRDMRPVEARMR